MKILFITTLYAECIMKFDAMYSDKDYSYKQLKDIIKDSFLAYYVSGYVSAFKNMNIEAEYIIYNSKMLQRAWEKENIKASSNFSKEEILISQVKDYGETIVFWDMVDSDLLNYLKMECSNVRAFVGWTGSAVAVSKQWKELDVVFSCAQESVNYLVSEGANAEQIHHAFPIDVLPNLVKKIALI